MTKKIKLTKKQIVKSKTPLVLGCLLMITIGITLGLSSQSIESDINTKIVTKIAAKQQVSIVDMVKKTFKTDDIDCVEADKKATITIDSEKLTQKDGTIFKCKVNGKEVDAFYSTYNGKYIVE